MPTETGSLLVVDDNPASAALLARLFTARGYQVTTSGDGREALGLFRRQPFDLILLDITMPGANGFAVLEAVRAAHPPTELPIIMATAHGQSEDIVRALDLGANDYVTKPYDFSVILARARTQLALKRSAEEQTRLERRLAQRNEELAEVNRKLAAANGRMKRDLLAAARIQEALLPHDLPRLPGVAFAWSFEPCEELAGDTLNIFPLDRDHVALYLLDVSGHGVAAALLSVTLHHFLSPAGGGAPVPGESGPENLLASPADVADYLNRRFAWEPETEQYFTMIYGTLDLRSGDFRYVCAGHPGPALVAPEGDAVLLDATSLPVGVGPGAYEERSLRLAPGARLYLYSDGLTDAVGDGGEMYGKARLLDAVARDRGLALEDSVPALLSDVHRWNAGGRPHDDISVLALEFTGPEGRAGGPKKPARVAEA